MCKKPIKSHVHRLPKLGIDGEKELLLLLLLLTLTQASICSLC